ncbi:zeta toxin family protein [Mangrovibacter phragmitis]|uniref:zeta toxin family protein n=1 Tax=Mangrovibacter phragmitis TaxID=1691903 RepID=UPI003369F784
MNENHKKEILTKISEDFLDDIQGLSNKVATHIRDDVFKYLSEGISASEGPIIMFTAGAPACGKSETVKHILNEYPDTVHIDPDEFRGLFPYYSGNNADVYQKYCTKIMSRCFDKAVKGGFNIIHDTNFAHYETAVRNVHTALMRSYVVQIMYVYLDPRIAWKHAMRRDRKIRPDVFCNNFLRVRQTIKDVLSHPDFQGKLLRCRAYVYEEIPGQAAFSQTIHENITADTLDSVVPFNYSISDLEQIAV